MKRFKTRKDRRRKWGFIIIIIIILLILLLHFYNKNLSPKILNIALSKLDEITTLYIKQDITPINADLNKLVITTQNNNQEILMVDVNMDYAYEVMLEIIQKIQNNIFRLEKGEIEDFQNSRELKSHDGNIYISVPLGLTYDGLLFSNIGPKIPIKISFFEHVLGTVETTITGYGINNALMKVYLTVTLEQKLIIPYSEETIKKDYSLLLGSKVINGVVPEVYGGLLRNTSNIMEY